MMMPSIALPTGPYDWNEKVTSLSTYEKRLARLRKVMAEQKLTHAIIHGNIFDHEALSWFSNFTPKLGLALMLVPFEGEPRLVFSGGPGMKPSAQRLTWISDVSALKGAGKDVATWLGEGAKRVGLIAGASLLHGDWNALLKASGGMVATLDQAFYAMRDASKSETAAIRKSASVLQIVAAHLHATAVEGADLLEVVLEAERMAYQAGAQDIRLRVARRAWGRPVTLPDERMRIEGALPIALALRVNGYWSYGDFVLGDVASLGAQVKARMAASPATAAYANRVAFPEALRSACPVVQVAVDVNGARWSGLCIEGERAREWLFTPPGL